MSHDLWVLCYAPRDGRGVPGRVYFHRGLTPNGLLSGPVQSENVRDNTDGMYGDSGTPPQKGPPNAEHGPRQRVLA